MILNSVTYKFNNVVKVVTMNKMNEVDELVAVASKEYLDSKPVLSVEVSTLIHDIVLHVVESSNDDNENIICAVVKDYNKTVLFYVLCDKVAISTISFISILTDIVLSVLCYTAGLAEDAIEYMKDKVESNILDILGGD